MFLIRLQEREKSDTEYDYCSHVGVGIQWNSPPRLKVTSLSHIVVTPLFFAPKENIAKLAEDLETTKK